MNISLRVFTFTVVGEESFANNKSHKSSEDVVEKEPGNGSDISRGIIAS